MEDGQSLLHECADLLGSAVDLNGRGHAVLSALLGARADPRSLNSLGESPLSLAARAIACSFASDEAAAGPQG